MTETAHDIIRIEDLRISVDLKGTPLEVVRGASFRIPAGKTVALVGESGSGKSVIAQAIMGILPPVISITGGHIHFAETPQDEPLDLAAIPANSKLMRNIRGGRISIIFQEPMTSLSPLHTIGDQIGESYRLHTGADRAAALVRAREMLEEVPDPTPMVAYFERWLRRLIETARGKASRVLVVRQPWMRRDFSAKEDALLWNFGAGRPYVEEVTTYYSHAVVNELMGAVDRVAGQVADELGVEQIDLMGRLEHDFETFYDRLHFTPAGARVVGEALARAILEGASRDSDDPHPSQ